MAIKKYKPTSPGRRGMSVSAFDEITAKSPEKSLLAPEEDGRKKRPRQHHGAHRGGGQKEKYRVIDFKRNKDGIPAKVATIEYDPNRTANIALLHYADGEKRYILAPIGLRSGIRCFRERTRILRSAMRWNSERSGWHDDSQY